MCSLEWPDLSLLQVVHSQWSPWTVIPLRWDYLLPPSTFPPSKAQHTSFPNQHLVFSPSHWRLMFTRSCYPLSPFVDDLSVKSPRTLVCSHPNDFWIINPILPLEFSMDCQALMLRLNRAWAVGNTSANSRGGKLLCWLGLLLLLF